MKFIPLSERKPTEQGLYFVRHKDHIELKAILFWLGDEFTFHDQLDENNIEWLDETIHTI